MAGLESNMLCIFVRTDILRRARELLRTCLVCFMETAKTSWECNRGRMGIIPGHWLQPLTLFPGSPPHSFILGYVTPYMQIAHMTLMAR